MLLLSSNMPRLQEDAASDLVQPDGMSTHRWCADRPKLTACPRCQMAHGVSGRGRPYTTSPPAYLVRCRRCE